MTAYPVHNAVIYDVECFPAWFEVGFEFPNGNVYQYQRPAEIVHLLEYLRANRIPLVGFNSNAYDDHVLTRYLETGDPDEAFHLSVDIIHNNARPWHQDHSVRSIDLMPILPGRMSLKRLGVCLGHHRLQELPIPFNRTPTPEEQRTLYDYNRNDLEITRKLYEHLLPDLELRQAMSDQYGIDLRSRGEAALAEQVLLQMDPQGRKRKELNEQGLRIVKDDPRVWIIKPSWWDKLVTPEMKVLRRLGDWIFSNSLEISASSGRIEGKDLNGIVYINDRYYQMGVGGLHSIDGAGAWVPDEDELLLDVDVASYYPNIILTQGLYPRQWGPGFLDIYREIVTRRMEAKRSGDKTTAAILKISANGTFGKSSDLFSAIYDPQMTANVTVLGQLGLLTLIQMLEGLATVCSANTDGVSILLKKSHWPAVKAKLDLWQSATELDLERTDYTGLYQKDVNNYVAAKPTAEVKLKGRFVDKWPNLRGMPNANIVATAVSEHAARGLSIKHTIHRCRDLNQFLLTQNVNSDWTTSWNDKQLGNILRFYKSNRPDKAPIIRTPKSGSDAKGNEGVVPDSDGCVPVEDLPEEFPEDINYGWYVREAEKLWKTISAAKRRGGNQWAELYHRMGLRPCPVDPKVKTPSRAGVAYGTIDFTSLPEGWVIGTATGAGILARVHADPPSTRLFRVDRTYPSKTRAKVLKDHGFVQYYGARVPLYGAPILEDAPKDENLDSYYTPAELNRLTQ